MYFVNAFIIPFSVFELIKFAYVLINLRYSLRKTHTGYNVT